MNKRYLAKLGSPITRPPGDLPKLGGKLHQHGPTSQALTSVRTAMHQGHEIAITTTYSITVDGKPLSAHVEVDDLGRVHCHGLPNYNFPSALDMVKAVIDSEPDTYPKRGRGGRPTKTTGPAKTRKTTKTTKPTKPTKTGTSTGSGGHEHDHEHDHDHDHMDGHMHEGGHH